MYSFFMEKSLTSVLVVSSPDCMIPADLASTQSTFRSSIWKVGITYRRRAGGDAEPGSGVQPSASH